MIGDGEAPAEQPAAASPAGPGRLFNRNYLLLHQGQFISRLGNQAFDIGMILWVPQITGSAALMSVLVAVSSIPNLLLAPIGGVLADRYSRKQILVLSDLCSGLAVLSLVAVIVLFPQAISLQVAWVFGVSTILSVIGAFFAPAIAASIPDLVPRNRLSTANSLGQLSLQSSQIIGAAAGGTLFALLGAPVLFLANGISFLFASASESLIRIPQRLAAHPVAWRARLAAFRQDLAEGLQHVWRSPGLRALVLLSAVGNFFSAPFIILLQFYVSQQFGIPLEQVGPWVGTLSSGFAIGSLLGFVGAGVLALDGRARQVGLAVAMVTDAAAYASLVLMPGPLAGLGLVLLIGALDAFVTVNITSLMQLTTPTEIRGRVFGLLGTIAGSITPIAISLSGVVYDAIGSTVVPIFVACSAVMLALNTVLLLNASIRQFLAVEARVVPETC